MKRTKELIITAFEELLDEKPLNKISVKDIVERCQVNRNTFYYYFQDIPALIQEVNRNITDQVIDRSNCDFDSPMECIRPVVEYCTAKKKLVLHIYKAVPREAFQRELERSCRYAVERYFETAAEGLALNENDRALLLRFYKCLMIGIVLDWLDSGMNYDAIHDAERICILMRGSTEQAFRNSIEKKPER